MSVDIRVDSTWLTHRKRWRLYDALGAEAVLAIMDLWLYTALHYPIDGVLRGMTEQEIVRASNYQGQGDLVKALVDVRLLDPPHARNRSYKLHAWTRRQSWLANSGVRSMSASVAGKASANKRKSPTDRVDDSQRHVAKNSTPFLSFPYLTYPKYCVDIYNALMGKVINYRPNHKIGKPDVDCKHIDLMVRIDKRSPERVLVLLDWYPIGQPYIPEIFSANTLREKYDRLESAYARNKKEDQVVEDDEEKMRLNKQIAEKEMATLGINSGSN